MVNEVSGVGQAKESVAVQPQPNRLNVYERVPSIAKVALKDIKPQEDVVSSLKDKKVVINPKYDKWNVIPGPVVNFFLNIVGFFGFIDQPQKDQVIPRHILLHLSSDKLATTHPESFKLFTDRDLRNLEPDKLAVVAPHLTQDQFKSLTVNQYKQLLTQDIKNSESLNSMPFELLQIISRHKDQLTEEEVNHLESHINFLTAGYIEKLDRLDRLNPRDNEDVARFFEWVDAGIIGKMPEEKAKQIPPEFFDLQIIKESNGEYLSKLGNNLNCLSDNAILNLPNGKIKENPILLFRFLSIVSKMSDGDMKGTAIESQIIGAPLHKLTPEQFAELKKMVSTNSFFHKAVISEDDRRTIPKMSPAEIASQLDSLLRLGKGKYITKEQMEGVARDPELFKAIDNLGPDEIRLLGDHIKYLDPSKLKPDILKHLTDEQTELVMASVLSPNRFRNDLTIRQKAIVLSILQSNKETNQGLLNDLRTIFKEEFEKAVHDKRIDLDVLKDALEGSSGDFRRSIMEEIFNKDKYTIDSREFKALIPFLHALPGSISINELLQNNRGYEVNPSNSFLNNDQVKALTPEILLELHPSVISSLFIHNDNALTYNQVLLIKSREDENKNQFPNVKENLNKFLFRKNLDWQTKFEVFKDAVKNKLLVEASKEQIQNIKREFWSQLTPEEIIRHRKDIARVLGNRALTIQDTVAFINQFEGPKFKALSLDNMPAEVFSRLTREQVQQLKPSDFASNPVEKLNAIKDPTSLPRIVTFKISPQDWQTLKRDHGSLYSKLRRMHATLVRDLITSEGGNVGFNAGKMQQAWKAAEGRNYIPRPDGIPYIEMEDVKRFTNEKLYEQPLDMRIKFARVQQYEGFTDGDIYYNPVKGGDAPHVKTLGDYSVAVNSSHESDGKKRGNDPIADNMRFVSFQEERGDGEIFIMTGVDPAGNSAFATDAGRSAASGSESYIIDQLEHKGVSNTREMTTVLLDSLKHAVSAIPLENKQNVCISTVVGKKDPVTKKAYCMAVGLGDMAIRVVKADGTVKNYTPGIRNSSSDVTDPGGRLSNPDLDLRNVGVVYFEMDAGDTLLMTSDGPEDKLDPEFNGLSPGEALDEIHRSLGIHRSDFDQVSKNWNDSPEFLDIKEQYKAMELSKIKKESAGNLAEAFVKESYARTEGRREIDRYRHEISNKGKNAQNTFEEERFMREANESNLGSKVTLPDGRIVVRGKDDDDSAQAYAITF